MSDLVEVTYWPSLTEPHGRRARLEWRELLAELAREANAAHDGRGWSPATFRDDRRRKEAVERVFAVGLDFDQGGDPHAVARCFGDVAAFVHTTRSHTPEAPRCRAIVLLDRPVTASEYATVWASLAARAGRAGLEVDAGTKDPSRLWFLPSRPRGGEAEFVALDGAPLGVDGILAEVRPVEIEPPSSDGGRNGAAWAEGALESACRALRGTSKGARNSTLSKEAYSLGGIVGAGLLERARVVRELGQAIDGWDPAARDKHLGTLERQLDEGARRPRHAPERDADEGETGRRAIRLGPDLFRVVDEAIDALGGIDNVYQREGELVRVVRAQEADPLRGIVPGTPRIVPLAPATLFETLTRIEWERYDKRAEEFRPCAPSSAVVAAVLERGEYPGVAPLSTVVETPTLRADGSILDVEGYDRATGLLFEPSCRVARVGERPSREEAKRALEELVEVFADFPFANAAARYVPIAILLTLVGRPAIRGSVPMVAIDASTRGSGKSLLADVVAKIATGRGAPRMTYPADEAELEKTLSSAALFGARLICLDNIAGALGAAPLDKVLTAEDRVAMRVLGKSELREIPWRAAIMATGNNIVLGADTARRTLVCRLEPDVERPEERTGFRHADLLGFVGQRRGHLVHAALTILRAFVAAGRPDASSFTWGSFASWAELVSAAIAWAGGPNVLEARAVSLGVAEPDTDALRAFLDLFPSLAPQGATTRQIVSTLYPETDHRERRAPDGFDGLRDALETLCPGRYSGDVPNPKRLGHALKRHLGRIVGGRKLVNREARDRNHQVLWAVEGPSAGFAGFAGFFPNPSRASLPTSSEERTGEHPREVREPREPVSGAAAYRDLEVFS